MGALRENDMAMTLEEILQDIHGLDTRLRELEQRYGLLSEDFYTLYRLGELEQSRDLIRWVGYYELRQERQRKAEFYRRFQAGQSHMCNLS